MNCMGKLTGSMSTWFHDICGCCDVSHSARCIPWYVSPKKNGNVHSEGGDRLQTQDPPWTRALSRAQRRQGRRRLERQPRGEGYPEIRLMAGTNLITHEKPSFVRKTATARSSPLARALSRHMERTLTANVRTARKLAGHCCDKLGPLPARAPSRAIRERILFSPSSSCGHHDDAYNFMPLSSYWGSSALLFAYCIFARYRSRRLGGDR